MDTFYKLANYKNKDKAFFLFVLKTLIIMIRNYTILLLILFSIFSNKSSAQDSYWVFFSDKKGVEFNPYEYFDTKAIERRIKNGLPINDPSDWPLNQSYVNTLSHMVDSISGQTRWFNALAVIANPEQIKQIQELDFVKEVRMMKQYAVLASEKGCVSSYDNNNLRTRQLEILGLSDFRKAGIDGKGVRIAVFDGGFPAVNTILALEQIRNEKRLIGTWDFTKNKEFVYYSVSHGTMVLTNIGGLSIIDNDSIQFGLATGAEFLLAKTEVIREPYSEEKNWLMAVEWADKNGADIINSSLGYTRDRYFESDMDGRKSLVSQAGNMAARKGILVVNAIGNDGDTKWETMGAPADADSVLAVGGIDPVSNFHISFSSYGPSADGRLKPNVCAFGKTIVSNKKDALVNVQGTSFASPLIAGFAACAMQANPNMKVMDLFHLIEQSGHLYPYYDYAHGYGIPQAEYVLTKQRKEVKKNFEVEYKGLFLEFLILDFNETDIGSSNLMYLNIEKEDGTLINYQVINVNQKKFVVESLYPSLRDDLKKITIYYKGYIEEIPLNN